MIARKQALIGALGRARNRMAWFTGARLRNPAKGRKPLNLLCEITGRSILHTLSFLSNLFLNGHIATSFLIFVLIRTPGQYELLPEN
jgi:hypothetical protein